MKKFLTTLTFGMAMLAGLAAPSAHAVLVTFDTMDQQGAGGTLNAGDSIVTGLGFNFTQANNGPNGTATLFAGETFPGYASNGSPGSLLASNGANILLNYSGGDTFNLLSLDFGGGNLGDPSTWASTLTLTGLTADGDMLIDVETIDSSFTGLSMLSLSNWRNLTQVTFSVTGGDYSLDSLNLTVPEPGSALLLALGLMGMAVSRKRGQD